MATDVELAATQTTANDHWPIFGHALWVKWLHSIATSTAQDARQHAYLLLGSPQIGKTTLARLFAQALLCTAAHEARPCGACRSCRLFEAGSHPDFRFVQPLDKDGNVDRAGGMLREQQATEIIREAALRPVEATRKIFLLQDVQSANPTFANKLLKTLEEPPAHVTLLLTATDRSQLLPTIVSRCQLLELRPLSSETVEQALVQRWQVAAERARLLARLSGGRLGWAVQQLDDAAGSAQRSEQLAWLEEMLTANRIQRLDRAAKLAGERDSQTLFGLLATWTSWWRDVMLVQNHCADLCTNLDQQERLARVAEQLRADAVEHFLHTLQQTEAYLQHTTNTRLALDVLLLEMPRATLP